MEDIAILGWVTYYRDILFSQFFTFLSLVARICMAIFLHKLVLGLVMASKKTIQAYICLDHKHKHFINFIMPFYFLILFYFETL